MPEWPAEIRSLTSNELTDVVESSQLVGIHCWANWNAHDYEFAQRLTQIIERFPDLALFAMDIENQSNIPLMADWHILNVPAFVIFRGGSRLSTLWMQGESVAEFQARIETAIIETVG